MDDFGRFRGGRLNVIREDNIEDMRDDVKSNVKSVSDERLGVQRGSVLSPCLFPLVINEHTKEKLNEPFWCMMPRVALRIRSRNEKKGGLDEKMYFTYM